MDPHACVDRSLVACVRSVVKHTLCDLFDRPRVMQPTRVVPCWVSEPGLLERAPRGHGLKRATIHRCAWDRFSKDTRVAWRACPLPGCPGRRPDHDPRASIEGRGPSWAPPHDLQRMVAHPESITGLPLRRLCGWPADCPSTRGDRAELSLDGVGEQSHAALQAEGVWILIHGGEELWGRGGAG